MCAVFALALLPFTLVCVVTGDIDPRRAIAFHAAADLTERQQRGIERGQDCYQDDD